MHVSLSDLVTCPRCGPAWGLVLMPEEVRERRVVAGVLGCANCRERYRVEGGVADLRLPGDPGRSDAAPPEAGEGEAAAAAEPGEAVIRLAALLDLAGAVGTVLLLGPASSLGGRLAALVEGVEVVEVVAGAPAGVGSPSVSRLRVGEAIPLRSGSVRGVALTGGEAGRLEEAARVVSAGGRLVVEPALPSTRERLEAAGLRVVAEEGGTVVATR